MREFAGARALSGEGRCSPVSASELIQCSSFWNRLSSQGPVRRGVPQGQVYFSFFQCLHKLQTNTLPPRPLLICINEYICMQIQVVIR